jgi:8-oxo-dGTP pyrophosphatase MutT (NUDIX family)
VSGAVSEAKAQTGAARLPDLHLLATPPPLPAGRPAAVLASLWPPRGADDEWRLLFIERSRGQAAHAGQLAFPGGAMEAGDADADACALREAYEEIGLEAGWVRVLGYLVPVPIPVSGFAVQPVVAAVTAAVSPADLRPAAVEVARIFLRSRTELAAAAGWERRPPQSLRVGAWPVFGLPEGRLWGATAVMVKQLLRRWPGA